MPYTDEEKLEMRVKVLEDWKNSQAVENALSAQRQKHIDERFDKLETIIREMKDVGNRMFWILISGIGAAAVSFILRGGLVNVGP